MPFLSSCAIDSSPFLNASFGAPVRDPRRWNEYGGVMRDLLPIWGHQAQWDIRQYPPLRRTWATLWGSDALWVTLDSCRFLATVACGLR